MPPKTKTNKRVECWMLDQVVVAVALAVFVTTEAINPALPSNRPLLSAWWASY
jgi:hypothetical protein